MRAILTVLVAATAAFLVYGLAVDNTAVGTYVPTTIILTVLIAALHRSADFSIPTLWALTAIAIGNLAGGILLVDQAPLYELDIVASIRFDKVYHASASAVAVVASFEALEHWTGRRARVLLLPAFLMALGAGALVEVVEYAATLFRENTLVGDYRNNAQDLIANTVGALTAVAVLWVWTSRRKPTAVRD